MSVTGLSFTPSGPSTKAWSRVLGTTLIAGALVLTVWSTGHDRAAYPALDHGISATGMLGSVSTEADGDHATVAYTLPSGAQAQATSIEPITGFTATGDGRDYKVWYLPHHSATTFIESVDHVKVDWAPVGGAVGAALIGLLFLGRPFKVRCTPKRPRPQGRHR